MRRVTVPTSKTNLYTLLDQARHLCKEVIITARTSNAGDVRFAVGAGIPKAELAAGDSVSLTINTLKNIWVVSDNGTEEINVTVL